MRVQALAAAGERLVRACIGRGVLSSLGIGKDCWCVYLPADISPGLAERDVPRCKHIEGRARRKEELARQPQRLWRPRRLKDGASRWYACWRHVLASTITCACAGSALHAPLAPGALQKRIAL